MTCWTCGTCAEEVLADMRSNKASPNAIINLTLRLDITRRPPPASQSLITFQYYPAGERELLAERPELVQGIAS